MLEKQRIIDTYRNDKLGVLLKYYQVKTTDMNKPVLKDIWKEILDMMDPHLLLKKRKAKY